MSILNVNTIQPVGSGQTITVSATNISAPSTVVTASSFVGNVTATTISGVSTAGITTAYIGSINDGALSGARNRIINGGMDIWQRGTSTTTTGNTYLADRWLSAFTTGGTVSQDTSSVPTGSRYVWKFTSSASNTFMQMGQQIEYVNCLDLQGQTVTISFYAKANNTNSGSTALIVRTRTGASVDAVVYFSGTNVDTSVTLTTSWVKYTVLRTLPATFGALSLEFALGSHVSGDGFAISQIQLEPGTVATPFERRSYGQELALCQRYCQRFRVFPTSSFDSFMAYYGGTNALSSDKRLTTPMRATPIASFTNASVQYYSYAGSWTNTTLLASIIDEQMYYIYCSSDGDGRSKLMRNGGSGLDPDPIVTFSAEL